MFICCVLHRYLQRALKIILTKMTIASYKHKQSTTISISVCDVIFVSLCLINSCIDVNAFNLEFRKPILKRGEVGSYFGYSVAEHIEFGKTSNTPWILVGAPKGKNMQPETNRSGALFKCPLTQHTLDCVQVVTDGRRPQHDFYDDLEEDDKIGKVEFKDDDDGTELMPPGPDEIKNGQWLGVTLKTQKPGGKVLVCAHRYIKSTKLSETHHGLGLCHLLNGNLAWEEALEPCDGKPMTHEHLEYAYCQSGTSLAFMEDGTALVGAPGPHTWRGTIFAKMTVGDYLTKDKQYYSSPLNQLVEPIDKYSYLGMSVAGGRFFDKTRVTYVSGAPRANLTGQVYFIEKHSPNTEMSISLILKGDQFASNYGYDLLAADVNNDGYDDLFVAAPFYFKGAIGGAVYIYYNIRHCTANYTCKPDEVLYGKEESRFGFSMTTLGDINKDGYNDVAIGAPYETIDVSTTSTTGGAIYVYLGNADMKLREPSQRIIIPNYSTIGYSLSGGMDLDDNGYPDLLTGAYNEDTVMLFKTRPIIHIDIEVKGEELKNIDTSRTGCSGDKNSLSTCFTFKICITLKRPAKFRRGIRVVETLKADDSKGKYVRVKLDPSLDKSNKTNYLTLTADNVVNCQDHTVYIKDGIRDILSPIEFNVSYRLDNTEAHSPMLNKTSTKLFQANFVKDCGSNDVCESILKISAGLPNEPKDAKNNLYGLDLGSIEELKVQVQVSNEGEPAYEANVYIRHPNVLSYIALTEKLNDIKCIYFNDTLVICNLGNPFGKNKTVNMGLRFENKNNQKFERELNFTAFVNTTSNTIAKEISASFTVEVNMTANVKIDAYGTSYVNYGGTVKGESAIKHFDEIGSRISHVYQVTNDGKWPVSNLLAQIDWPIQIASNTEVGKWLLYLESVPIVEFDNTLIDDACEIVKPFTANELNYTRSGYDGAQPENFMMAPANIRQRNDVPSSNPNVRRRRDVNDNDEIVPARLMVGPVDNTKNNYTFDCQTRTAICATIVCRLPIIPRNLGVTIRITSRLWNSTLIEDFSDKSSVTIISRAFIQSTNDSVEIDPTQSTAAAATMGISMIQGIEGSIPYWIIIAAVAAGLILFFIILYLMKRCGFFKRNYPPTSQGNIERPEEAESRSLLK